MIEICIRNETDFGLPAGEMPVVCLSPMFYMYFAVLRQFIVGALPAGRRDLVCRVTGEK